MEVLARSSYIRRKDMDSVLNCIVSDRLETGEFTEKFIRVARERLGFEFGVALRNPMIAFDTALTCLGLASGDSIAMSALSPRWSHRIIEARGLNPVWLDVDSMSASISEKAIKELAGSASKALFLAEPWGIMPDPAPCVELGLPIIEDATLSIGASAGDVKAGGIGTFVIVGLEPACSITAGGGAMLYAPGRREAQALRNVAEQLCAEELMTDMNAALGLAQIKDLDKFLEKRRELSELYGQSLARAHRKNLTATIECEPSNFGCVVVLESGAKDVRAYARKKDVDTAMAFDDTCAAAGVVPEGLCPQALSLVNRSVAFPLSPRIGKTAAQKIARVLATLP